MRWHLRPQRRDTDGAHGAGHRPAATVVPFARPRQVGAIALGWVIDRLTPHLVLGSAYAPSAAFIAVVAFGASNLWVLMPATFLAGFGVVGTQIVLCGHDIRPYAVVRVRSERPGGPGQDSGPCRSFGAFCFFSWP
ncbi:hypothetical protein M2351_003982 [Azospirillum canadense]|nr:hypothetical protein [Azospirillum canadense]